MVGLSAMQLTGLPLGQKQFRDQVQRYVETTLKPKLTEREKRRLEDAWRTGWPPYLRVVWVQSRAHDLQPPGGPENWRKFIEGKGK